MSEQPSLLPMASGEALRARRLGVGLSVQQAAEQIKCPPAILDALELDQEVTLAPIYLRGHIKRYCDLLGLDQEHCSSILDRYASDSPNVQTVFETVPKVRASDRWLRVASYVLASLLVGTLAWQVTHEAVRLTSIEDRTSPVASPAVDTDSSAVSHVNASIASLEQLYGPAGSRTGNAGAQAWEAIESTRQVNLPLSDGLHRLVLQTSADSWVEITGADNKLLEQDLLRGGESRQYSDGGPFRISLGRSSAISLTLDGQLIDLEPFTRDDVARLLLDPAKAKSLQAATENRAAADSAGDNASGTIPPPNRQAPEG